MISILLTVVVLILTTRSLTVQEVDAYLGDKTIRLAGVEKLQGIFLFGQSKKIEEILKEHNPAIEETSVDIVAPGKIKVQIEMAEEVAYMSDGKSYVILSDKAKILRRVYEIPKSLGEVIVPETYIVRPLVVGKYISSSDVKFGVETAKIFTKNAISAFRIDIKDSNLIECRLPTDDITIKLSNDSTAAVSHSRLDEFLQRLYTTSTGKKIKVLDLRFGKTVTQEK